MKAVALVGGYGTRLRPLTFHTPKSMVGILNRPFLEHVLAYLHRYSIEEFILAVSYMPEEIRSHFGDGEGSGIRLAYSVEEQPLGTAGAVKNAEAHLDGTCFVLNGDIFTDLNINAMLDFHRKKGAKVTIALIRVEDPSAFGVVVTDSNGRVESFVEKPPRDEAPSDWINAGIYIIEPEVLELAPAGKPSMFERDLFPELIERGEPVYGYPFTGYWLDMGTPAKYFSLNSDLLAGKVESALLGRFERGGVVIGEGTRVHPTARITGPALIGRDCVIEGEAVLNGPVVLDDGCVIGRKAAVSNSILWKKVRLGQLARLERCIVSEGVVVEPGQEMVGTVLTPDVAVPLELE